MEPSHGLRGEMHVGQSLERITVAACSGQSSSVLDSLRYALMRRMDGVVFRMLAAGK